ncbi:MAG: hypothetical protein ACRYG8_39445 [Janthinobacterium lividum]
MVTLDRSSLKEMMFNCTQHNGAFWVEQAVGADDIADLDRGGGVIVVAFVDAGTLYGFRASRAGSGEQRHRDRDTSVAVAAAASRLADQTA